jgi:hypothetical protein
MVKLIQSISEKQAVRVRKPKSVSDENELEILKRRKKDKSIPMDVFFKKLENA